MFDLYTKLLKAVSSEYKNSTPAANVTGSKLPTGEYYFSIVSFKGKNKKTEMSAKNKEPEVALQELVLKFLEGKTPPSALAELQLEVKNRMLNDSSKIK